MKEAPSNSFRLLLAVLALPHALPAQAPTPIYPDREWQESRPEAQGVDGAKLDEAMQYLGNSDKRYDTFFLKLAQAVQAKPTH